MGNSARPQEPQDKHHRHGDRRAPAVHRRRHHHDRRIYHRTGRRGQANLGRIRQECGGEIRPAERFARQSRLRRHDPPVQELCPARREDAHRRRSGKTVRYHGIPRVLYRVGDHHARGFGNIGNLRHGAAICECGRHRRKNGRRRRDTARDRRRGEDR